MNAVLARQNNRDNNNRDNKKRGSGGRDGGGGAGDRSKRARQVRRRRKKKRERRNRTTAKKTEVTRRMYKEEEKRQKEEENPTVEERASGEETKESDGGKSDENLENLRACPLLKMTRKGGVGLGTRTLWSSGCVCRQSTACYCADLWSCVSFLAFLIECFCTPLLFFFALIYFFGFMFRGGRCFVPNLPALSFSLQVLVLVLVFAGYPYVCSCFSTLLACRLGLVSDLSAGREDGGAGNRGAVRGEDVPRTAGLQGERAHERALLDAAGSNKVGSTTAPWWWSSR